MVTTHLTIGRPVSMTSKQSYIYEYDSTLPTQVRMHNLYEQTALHTRAHYTTHYSTHYTRRLGVGYYLLLTTHYSTHYTRRLGVGRGEEATVGNA